MNRREFLLLASTCATVAGVEGISVKDYLQTSGEINEAVKDIQKTSPAPSDAEVKSASEVTRRYTRCEQETKIGKRSENECRQAMQRDAKEIYNAARVLEQERVTAEAYTKLLPLNERFTSDGTWMIWGMGIGLGVAIGAAIMRYTGE